MMQECLSWKFPLHRTHAGILQGNGMMGIIIWGAGNLLNITVGRSDFWDHRGGLTFTEKHSFENIHRILESHDCEKMEKLFETDSFDIPGFPRQPSIIPIGRLTINVGEEAEFKTGIVMFAEGIAEITYIKNNISYKIKFVMAMDENVQLISFDSSDVQPSVKAISAWNFVGEYLKTISFDPPVEFEDEDGCGGFVQQCPSDPALSLAYKLLGYRLAMSTARDNKLGKAKETALEIVKNIFVDRFEKTCVAASNWWENYWRDVPVLELPDKELEVIFKYNMYKSRE